MDEDGRVLALLPPLATVPGLALAVASDRPPAAFALAASLVASVVLLARAWQLREQPALVLDAEGVRDAHGRLLVRWAGCALVWVGEAPGWYPRWWRYPDLRLWEAPALDYAARTGFVPMPALMKAGVQTTLSTPEVAALVRRFTAAPVHTGGPQELARLIRGVRHPSG